MYGAREIIALVLLGTCATAVRYPWLHVCTFAQEFDRGPLQVDIVTILENSKHFNFFHPVIYLSETYQTPVASALIRTHAPCCFPFILASMIRIVGDHAFNLIGRTLAETPSLRTASRITRLDGPGPFPASPRPDGKALPVKPCRKVYDDRNSQSNPPSEPLIYRTMSTKAPITTRMNSCWSTVLTIGSD